MKIKNTLMFSILSPARNRSHLAGSILLALTITSRADLTEFTGPEVVEPFSIYYWDDEFNWNAGVPTETDDVIVRVPEDENNQPIRDFGPLLQSDVTINSFVMEGDTQLRGNGENFSVQETSELKAVVNYGGVFSFGNLSDFNLSTRTLEGGPNLVISEFGVLNQPIMQFEGADIVTNNASIQIFGANAKLLDQNTSESAFQSFATNNGLLNFNDGFELETQGNFTNGPDGRIFLNYRNQGDFGFRVAKINIAGNFLNQGTVELYANTVFLVAGGLSGNGDIKVLGQPCSLNVAGTYLLEGGEFNFGGTGVDSFTLITTALVVNSGAKVTGNGTSQGSVSVVSGTIAPGNSAGQIQVNGDLTLEAGSTLDMEIGGTAHDKLTQSGGTTTLGGTLTLQVIDNFECRLTSTDTFMVLTSDQPLAGSFTNVTSGARLATADGLGTFLVTYGSSSSSPNAVVLSDFIAAPVATKTFNEWSVEQDFPSPDPGGDQNNNGILDMLEYTFGSSSGTPCIYTTTAVDDTFVWTFGVPKYVTGVTITSISFNNIPAFEIGAGPPPIADGSTASMNLYTITDSAASPKKFYQLKVELTQ